MKGDKMLLLVLGITIMALVIGCLIYHYGDNEVGGLIASLAGIFFCIALVATVFVGVNVSKAPYISDKIAMYEEENARIAEEVSAVVKSYIEYEGKTFTSISDASPITLVTMFPELKADTLVSKQIEIYVANNNIIKDLKVDAIDYKVQKWWLCFGN